MDHVDFVENVKTDGENFQQICLSFLIYVNNLLV